MDSSATLRLGQFLVISYQFRHFFAMQISHLLYREIADGRWTPENRLRWRAGIVAARFR